MEHDPLCKGSDVEWSTCVIDMEGNRTYTKGISFGGCDCDYIEKIRKDERNKILFQYTTAIQAALKAHRSR